MYRLFSIFFILFTSFIFNACETDSDSDSASEECLLHGDWELSYVVYGSNYCEYACASENALPSDCQGTGNYDACVTITVDDNGAFLASDSNGNSSGGTWTADCEVNAVVSAISADGATHFGIIESISSDEIRINSDDKIYVFTK